MPHTSHGEPFAGGSDTSYEAALRARAFVSQQGIEVFRHIGRCGAYGATQKEIAAAVGIGRPSVCARVKALEEAGAVAKTADRRAGCAVYVRSLGTHLQQLMLY